MNGPEQERGRARRRPGDHTHPVILAAAQSTAVRARLIAELNELGSADDAAHWARRTLPEKQRLIADDEQAIELAFAAKLATFVELGFEHHHDLGLTSTPDSKTGNQSSDAEAAAPRAQSRPVGIDKSVLVHPEPRRLRDRDHVKYVAQQPCLICGRRPSDAHHLRFVQPMALGRKASDEFTVPLCRGHHRELHRCGDENSWWNKAGIDPTVHARKLWLDTHPLPTRPGGPLLARINADPAVAERQRAQKRNGSQGIPRKLRNEANYKGVRP